MMLYPTPPSILTLVTWVQRTQAWPSANSARRLAFGQTESYSVQPRLPLAATIGGRSRVFFDRVPPLLDSKALCRQLRVVLQLGNLQMFGIMTIVPPYIDHFPELCISLIHGKFKILIGSSTGLPLQFCLSYCPLARSYRSVHECFSVR